MKKIKKNATNEISNNEKTKKKRFFDIFRLGKPRVANLTQGTDFNRETLQRLYIFENFFLWIQAFGSKSCKKKVFVRRK